MSILDDFFGSDEEAEKRNSNAQRYIFSDEAEAERKAANEKAAKENAQWNSNAQHEES